MAAENFLHKQIGPFNGITWIGIIGGGAILAYLLRRGFGGGSSNQDNQPILVENVPLKGGLGGGTPGPPIGPGDQPPIATPPHAPPLPPLVTPPQPSPAQPPLPEPEPITPPPMQCPSGYHWDSKQRRCVKNPIIPPFPPPPNAGPPNPPPAPPPPRVIVPGGFPSDCTGVSYFPPDYAARKAMPTNKFQYRAIKLSWSVQNIAAGPSGIFAFAAYINSPASWPIINGIRRNRGLRALNTTEFEALRNDIGAIANSLGGQENRLSNTQILSLWEKYNTPYVCANVPARPGSRAMRLG